MCYPESDVSLLPLTVITHVATMSNDLCEHRQKSLKTKQTAQEGTEFVEGFVQFNVFFFFFTTPSVAESLLSLTSWPVIRSQRVKIEC